MLNFNTQESKRCRSGSHGLAKAASLMPNALKSGLAATVAILLLCCFSFQSATAQCNPDITAPTAICEGPFTIALNTNGNAPINPDDIDAGSFDNCGAVTLAVSPSSVNCSNIGFVLVTLTVTDLAGNTNTCPTLVTVLDNLPPAITCPPTYTFSTCPAATGPATTGFATAIDNCGGVLAQKAYCTLPGNGITYCDVADGCTGNGITRTWTARYAGLTSSCVQSIIVNDTQAPTVDWNGAGPGNPAPTSPLNLTCANPVPVAAFPGAATFADNCDGTPTATVTDVSTKSGNPSTCAFYTYTITRTYKVQDDCGNMFTYVQTINVTDATGPVITAPATVNVPAGAGCQTNVVFPAVTVTDNCAGGGSITTSFEVVNNVSGLTVNSGSGLNPSGVYAAGVYTVFFSAADPCGNLGFGSTALNVVDNVAPTAICTAALIEVSVDPFGVATLTPAMMNNGSYDNCTPAGSLVFTISPSTLNCSNVGLPNETITMTVTDANGNSNSCTANVQVTNNSAPAVFCKDIIKVLSAAPPFGGTVSATASELDNGSFDACDANGILEFHFVELNGLAIGATTSLGFDCSDVGVNTVIVRVRERDNNQAPIFINDGFCTQTITIQDNTPPTAVCTNITIPLDDDGMVALSDEALLFSYTNSPGTPIVDLATTTTTINAPSAGTIADLNVTLNISHTFLNDLRVLLTSPSGTTITLFDDAGCSGNDLLATFNDQAALTYAAFTAACDNSGSPEISGTFHPLGALAAFEGEDFNGVWTLTVIDEAGIDIGTINSWTLDFRNNYLDLLGPLSTDNCDVTWSATPAMFNCSDVGDQDPAPGIQGNPYTLTVTDPSGNTATCTGIITVTDPEAPVVTCAPITVSTGMLNPVTNVSTPGLVTVYPTDVVTGGLYMSTGNNGSGNPGTNNFQVTMPNVLTFTFDWSYVSNNSSPTWDKFGYYVGSTFTQLSNDNGALSQSGTATVSVTAGATFGFRAQTVDNLEGNAEIWITNFSPLFKGPFKPSNWAQSSSNSDGKQFFYDACGITNWAISKDGGANYFNSVPFTCADVTALPNPEPVIIRATDVSGNQTVCATTITVLDQEAPQAQCQPLLVSLNSGGNATVLATDVNFGSTDACCPAPLVYAISKDNGVNFNPSTSFTCANIGVNNVILRVTDCATVPNNAYCQTTITIKDQLPPAIICPANVTRNCDQSLDPSATGLATATDNCSTPTVTWENTNAVPANTPNCQVITRKWTATDNATPANISVCFQTITVVDGVAPSLDWNGATAGLGTPPTSPLAADACAVPAAAIATGVDNCATPTPVYNQTSTQGGNPANSNYYNYTITRTWSVSDNCGNSSSYVQTINVTDANAPVFSFPAMFMFNNNPGNCAGTANIGLLQYITDCALDQYLTVTYKIDNGAVQTGGTINAVLSVGSHTVLVTADDPSTMTGVVSTSFTIVIKDNESPTAICQSGPISVTLNSNGIANITPNTVNNGSNDNCGIASLNVNPATFDCFTTPNPHTVTLTVTDAAGNFNTCTTTILILNVSAPTIQCPAAATVSCSVFNPANPATSGGSATAMTACGPVATTYSDVTASGSGNCRVINRTWSATTAGGTATCLQVITVTDNVQPVLVGVPANATAQACAVPAQAIVTATDNCATPVVTPSQTSTQGANPALCSFYNYSLTRTWITTDGCTQPVSATQIVTVVDNTAPILSVPNPLIINTDPNKCEANVNINLLNYIADCAADQYLTVTNTAISGPGTSLIAGIYAAGNYNVSVTATDLCGNTSTQAFVLSIQDGQTPVAICLTDITVVLDNNGNATITVNEVNNGSYDNCGIASITLSDYDFDTNDAGQAIPVTMTVTDFAGNTNSCVILVHVEDDVTFRVNDVTAANGEMKLIPVTVNLFDDIVSFEMDFDIANTGVATIVDIVNVHPSLSGLIKTITPPGDASVSWIDNVAPFGVDLADGTIAFNLKVMVVGSTGNSTDIDINNLEVGQMVSGVPTVVPSLGLTGTLTVVATGSSFTLAGDLFERPDCGNDLVLQANVDYVGTVTGTLTNVPGSYSLVVPAGANETLTPNKNINNANGVTALDAFTAHQYAAGLPIVPALTPYQIIACDANNSNTVTTFDAFLIHQLSAGFPVSLPKSWRFVPTTTVLPANPFSAPFSESITHNNITANHLNDDFYGVKVGDVVGCNANPATFNGGSVADGNGNKVVLRVQDQPVVAGSDVYVTFKAKEFYQMITCQATLNFDAQTLLYETVVPGNVPNMNLSCFNPMLVAEGMLAAVWYNLDPVSLDNGHEVFTVKFKALKDAAALSNLIWVSADFVSIEAVGTDGVPAGVELTFDGSVSAVGEQGTSHFALHQNRPNPFSTRTAIGFNLPQADHATLTISDASGKTLKVLEGVFTAGYHQFMIERNDLPATGVFFYQLKTAEYQAVKKMILVD